MKSPSLILIAPIMS